MLCYVMLGGGTRGHLPKCSQNALLAQGGPPQSLSQMASASNDPRQEWLSRVSSVQRQRTTPEELQRVRERAERIKRQSVQAKKASRLSKSMQVSSAEAASVCIRTQVTTLEAILLRSALCVRACHATRTE